MPQLESGDFFEACEHPVSPQLAFKLTKAADRNVCPMCVIFRITDSIREVQRELHQRGGIFASCGDVRPKPAEHGVLNSRWRLAKVQGFNIAETLKECLAQTDWTSGREDGLVADVDEMMVRVALDIWEQEIESDELWKLPGQNYYNDEEELSDEEKERIRLVVEDLEEAVRVLLNEVNYTELPAEQNVGKVSCAEKLPTQSVDMPSTPARQSPLPSGTNSPPHSILKRKERQTPSATPSPNGCRKRVRTADYATICPETLTISNPSMLQPSSHPTSAQSTNQPTYSHQPSSPPALHFHRHPASNNIRRRKFFQRAHPSYMPGKWASPAFSEKANTSFCKVAWDKAARLVEKDEEESREEGRVVEGLKVVAGAWVGGWWIRNVVERVGFEKLRQMGDGGEEV